MTQAVRKIETVPAAVGKRKPWYIAGPKYDLVFFLLAPWLALGTAFAIYRFVSLGTLWYAEVRSERHMIFTLIFGPLISQAHIFLVFFRSHFNRDVFRRHKWRFTVVPVVVAATLIASLPALIVARVLAQFWDIYHSSLQTFGIARIYDRQRGNDPKLGRLLDIGLAHVIYIGPVIGGLNLIPTLAWLNDFNQLGWTTLGSLSWRGLFFSLFLYKLVIRAGAAYLLLYVGYYLYLSRRGYRVAWPKIALYVSTAVVSIVAWGVFPNDVCILTVNLFHAWQYFGIVWWAESGSLRSAFRLDSARAGKWLTLVAFVGVSLGYGLMSRRFTSGSRLIASLVLTCSLMHFWWDGFIWSVRRNHI